MRFRLANAAQLRLGMAEQGELAAAAGRPTVLGIRPEHLHPPGHGPAGSDAVSMQVEVVEHMGDHQYVYLRVSGVDETVIMKSPPHLRFAHHEIVPVQLDTTRAHVFADLTEHARNLTLPKGFAQQQ
jgi:ABC-type sugar transport system ATPase subunit